MADSTAIKMLAGAQTGGATADDTSDRPRDPRPLAIINLAKVPDSIESDIAPAVGTPSRRAITRRSMFMSIAVPALTGAAITPAVASSILAGPDPVFAAIERHREASDVYQQAEERTREARKAFEAQRDPRGVYLYDVPETTFVVEYPDGQRVTFADIADGKSPTPTGECCHREIETGRMLPVFADNMGDITRADEDDVECADFDAWKNEKKEEYLQWHGCYDDSIGVARELQHHAFECLVAATAELNVRPSTLAGVTALLRTVAEAYDGDDGDIWDGVVYDERDEDGDAVGDPVIDNGGLLIRIVETLADAVQSMRA
jgi:hypothetical protein